ncbi:MAG TPA: hypothetical protein VKT00_07840, partial [Casimicrobiaceae bacterium]|nr:hypothetical protein [Casimicrobiaceae bacterium]
APAGTPKDIVPQPNPDVVKVRTETEIRKVLASDGACLVGISFQELALEIQAATHRLDRLAGNAKIPMQGGS